MLVAYYVQYYNLDIIHEWRSSSHLLQKHYLLRQITWIEDNVWFFFLVFWRFYLQNQPTKYFQVTINIFDNDMITPIYVYGNTILRYGMASQQQWPGQRIY